MALIRYFLKGLILSFFSLSAHADISGLLGQEVKIINLGSDKALTVPSMSKENGTALVQYTYLGNADQKWKIEKTDSGHYRILNVNSNKALEVADQGLNNGDLARQWQYFDVPHHQWKIESLGANTYRLVSVNSGKVLEVADGSLDNHAAIRQWDYFDVPHHQWAISVTTRTKNALEAENALISGGAIINDASASGGRYFDLKANGKVTFKIEAANAGKYRIGIVYRSPGGNKKQSVLLDNQLIEQKDFAQQANWSSSDVLIDLPQGEWDFTIQANWGYMAVDRISVMRESSNNEPGEAVAQLLEAEHATLSGNVDTIEKVKTASNDAYAYLDDVGSLTFDVQIDVSGEYDLKIGYSARGEKRQHLFINDKHEAELYYPKVVGWGDVIHTTFFESGHHKVKIEASWGYSSFDYIWVIPKGGKAGIALYYDNLGLSFDYIERQYSERFTAPGDSPSPGVNMTIGIKNGDWVVETQWYNTSHDNHYRLNLVTGDAVLNDGDVIPAGSAGVLLEDYIKIVDSVRLGIPTSIDTYIDKLIEQLQP